MVETALGLSPELTDNSNPPMVGLSPAIDPQHQQFGLHPNQPAEDPAKHEAGLASLTPDQLENRAKEEKVARVNADNNSVAAQTEVSSLNNTAVPHGITHGSTDALLHLGSSVDAQSNALDAQLNQRMTTLPEGLTKVAKNVQSVEMLGSLQDKAALVAIMNYFQKAPGFIGAEDISTEMLPKPMGVTQDTQASYIVACNAMEERNVEFNAMHLRQQQDT